MKKSYQLSFVFFLSVILLANSGFVSTNSQNHALDNKNESLQNKTSLFTGGWQNSCMGCHLQTALTANPIIVNSVIHNPIHTDYQVAIRNFLNTNTPPQAAKKNVDFRKLYSYLNSLPPK